MQVLPRIRMCFRAGAKSHGAYRINWIRIALGAQPGDILRLIVGQGTKLALFGLSVGLTALFPLTRLMGGLLYGISATDPLAFGAVVIILLVVAMSACYLPARRALRVDPMIALRRE